MPDISMCLDHECPSCRDCFRYTAVPSERQTYGGFKHNELAGRCGYFWPNGTWCKRKEGEG